MLLLSAKARRVEIGQGKCQMADDKVHYPCCTAKPPPPQGALRPDYTAEAAAEISARGE